MSKNWSGSGALAGPPRLHVLQPAWTAQPRRRRLSVAHALDPLINAQIQAENSVAGSLAAQHRHLQHAGACLNEQPSFGVAPNGLAGMAAGLEYLFDSFQALAADPANPTHRRAVVDHAREVAAQFNLASSRLASLRNDLNASIQDDVVRVNYNLNEIAALNHEIRETLATGGSIAMLNGRRDQFLETLSSCVNITVTDQPRGCVNVSVGGVLMVRCDSLPESLATYPDRCGDLRLQTQNSCMRLLVTGGSIAGKAAARDGGLATLQAGLDRLAWQLIQRINRAFDTGSGLRAGDIGPFFTGTSAADICVNTHMTGGKPHPHGADGSDAVALALASLGSRGEDGLGRQSFLQSYVETVADSGQTLSSVQAALASSQVLRQMLANQRELAHTLSLDNEKTELQRYQQAYDISTKMVLTLDRMRPVK